MSNGSFPNKRLKVESITENRIEFCVSDSSARQVRYFFPHVPANEGLEKFKRIINGLDWSEDVQQHKNLFDYLSQMIGRPTKV